MRLNESIINNLNEEREEEVKYVWEDYDSYSKDEIEEINNIIDNLDLEAIKHEEHMSSKYNDSYVSVLIKDKNSGLEFWMDYSSNDYGITGEWNQYIFFDENSIDRKKRAIQTSHIEDGGYAVAYEEFESVGIDYLNRLGLVEDDKLIYNTILEEKFLFYNDLAEYKVSDQGKKLFSLIDSNRVTLSDFEDYWNARNNDKLTWSSDEEKNIARERDKELGQLLHDLD